jgi:hypothetical protein
MIKDRIHVDEINCIASQAFIMYVNFKILVFLFEVLEAMRAYALSS